MHVGLLTTSYPRFSGDAAGSFVAEFASAMRALGHRVDVMAPADAVERPHFDARHIRYLPRAYRRTFYESGVPDNVRNMRAWPGLLAYPAALTMAAGAKQWDAIVSHFGFPSAIVGALIAKGRPHLAVWHSADVALAGALGPFKALIPRLATQHWCVTQSGQQRLGLKHAIVAPMGAHLPNVGREASRLALGIARGQRVVSFVGRLVPIKGVSTLIQAAADLPLRILIAGDGPERSALESQARRLGLDATFFGNVAPSLRDQILMASDAFAMPSLRLGRRSEGAPCAVLEAQLAGLPVLASRSGGLVERVRDGVDGVLLPPGNPSAWRDALKALLRGEYVDMGARGAEANAHLTWSALGPKIERALTS